MCRVEHNCAAYVLVYRERYAVGAHGCAPAGTPQRAPTKVESRLRVGTQMELPKPRNATLESGGTRHKDFDPHYSRGNRRQQVTLPTPNPATLRLATTFQHQFYLQRRFGGQSTIHTNMLDNMVLSEMLPAGTGGVSIIVTDSVQFGIQTPAEQTTTVSST